MLVGTCTRLRLLRERVRLVYDFVTAWGKHGGAGTGGIVDLHGDQRRVGPIKFKKPADHFVEFGPGARGRRLLAVGCAAIRVVRICRGVNARQAFSSFDEIEERLPASLAGSRVFGVVQKLAGGAIQENRIIVPETLSVDGSGIVGDGSHPRAGFVSQIFHHLGGQWDGGVHPAVGLA